MLDVSGEVLTAVCNACNGEERTFLQLETGQRFEIREAPPALGPAVLRVEVHDWKSAHPFVHSK